MHLEGFDDVQKVPGFKRSSADQSSTDFTASFYIACFFAFESATDECAVWAVNRHLLDSNPCAEVDFQKDGKGYIAFQEAARRVADNVIRGSGATRLGVVALQPWRLNERLVAQQGLFLFPTDIESSFAENLCAALDADCFRPTLTWADTAPEALQGVGYDTVVKIVFPKDAQLAAMHELRRMNITYASLFPGLDGFAKSLAFHLRVHYDLVREDEAKEDGSGDAEA